jgi:hypothetical protein
MNLPGRGAPGIVIRPGRMAPGATAVAARRPKLSDLVARSVLRTSEAGVQTPPGTM